MSISNKSNRPRFIFVTRFFTLSLISTLLFASISVHAGEWDSKSETPAVSEYHQNRRYLEAARRDEARFLETAHKLSEKERTALAAHHARTVARYHSAVESGWIRLANAGVKLSALGAVGLGATALIGHTDTQASTVRGAKFDEAGRPTPVTLKDSNVGKSSLQVDDASRSVNRAVAR